MFISAIQTIQKKKKRNLQKQLKHTENNFDFFFQLFQNKENIKMKNNSNKKKKKKQDKNKIKCSLSYFAAVVVDGFKNCHCRQETNQTKKKEKKKKLAISQ